MNPWIQSNFNFPLSGNVNQKVDPDLFFGAIDFEAGDGEIEKEVFFKVAAYGKQLGLLTELILATVDEHALDKNAEDALQQLRMINSRVEAIKLSKQGNAKSRAKQALEQLKSHNPQELINLLSEYQ